MNYKIFKSMKEGPRANPAGKSVNKVATQYREEIKSDCEFALKEVCLHSRTHSHHKKKKKEKREREKGQKMSSCIAAFNRTLKLAG